MKRLLALAVLFLFLLNAQGALQKAYYLTKNGDSVHGKIEVRTMKYFEDSVNYYELQYGVLFVESGGKVIYIRPNESLKEIGFWFGGKVRKMHCLNTKEAAGLVMVKKRKYIFLSLALNGPMSIYSVVNKKVFRFIGYYSDISFYSRKERKHIRWNLRRSTDDFRWLAGSCMEAENFARNKGIFTLEDAFEFVYTYNKYCSE
ncbi:MAG TPA: hypothetical protein PLU73_07380 [Bacteroidia bacterium]|nr:hypothetical protein [Bacteroidia bacterium]